MRLLRGVVARGLAAGAVGAAAMAFWFLVIDAAEGVPFRTPAFLASSLLGLEAVEVTAGLVVLYTTIHFGAFMVVGMGVSWLLRYLETVPSILLGLVLGFLLFDIVFYASVYVTGVDVVEALGWVEVLAGNLIAGVCLMGFLHLTGAARPVSWWEALAEHRILREGLVAGLVGALTVAAWFFLFDAARGELFFTPGALGSALFLGVGEVEAIQVNVWTVLGYSLVHLAAFAVVGFIASAFVFQAEKTPPIILGAILLFVAFEAFFMGFLAMVAEFLLGALAWWTIAAGNILAVVAMGWYLWVKHPKLRKVMADNPLDRTV